MWLQTIKNLVLILIQVPFGSRARQQSDSASIWAEGQESPTPSHPCPLLLLDVAHLTQARPWRGSPWWDATSLELSNPWHPPPRAGSAVKSWGKAHEHCPSSPSRAAGGARALTSAAAIPPNSQISRCPHAVLSEQCTDSSFFGYQQQHHSSKQAKNCLPQNLKKPNPISSDLARVQGF